MKILSLRLPPDIHSRISEVAAAERRSVNSTIVVMLDRVVWGWGKGGPATETPVEPQPGKARTKSKQNPVLVPYPEDFEAWWRDIFPDRRSASGQPAKGSKRKAAAEWQKLFRGLEATDARQLRVKIIAHCQGLRDDPKHQAEHWEYVLHAERYLKNAPWEE